MIEYRAGDILAAEADAPPSRRIWRAFIEGYGDGGDAPSKPLEVVSGTMEKVDDLTRDAALRAGFEAPSGLKPLTTVHCTFAKEGIPSEEGLAEAVHAWGARKRAFTQDQIRLAEGVLERKGWLSSSGDPSPRQDGSR